MTPDTSLDVLDDVNPTLSDTSSSTPGTSADSATAEGTTGQSNGSVPGTTYDDSKVIERLDGIIKRFDTVDDALKTLSSRGDTKAEVSSTVTIDSAQYEEITGRESINMFLVLCSAVLLAFLLGTYMWDLFCRLFRSY